MAKSILHTIQSGERSALPLQLLGKRIGVLNTEVMGGRTMAGKESPP